MKVKDLSSIIVADEEVIITTLEESYYAGSFGNMPRDLNDKDILCIYPCDDCKLTILLRSEVK